MGIYSTRSRSGGPIRFGDHEFDWRNRQLTHHGNKVSLGGQPMLILELLLRQPGMMFSRADLQRQLWPRAARIDTSRRLNTAVRALRLALDDTADTPRFIETVRGAGYRFIGPVDSRRRQHHLAALATMIIVTLMLVSSDQHTVHSVMPAPDLSAYLRAVSAFDTEHGVNPAVRAGLSSFSTEHPDYQPAAMLLAKLAVRDWRHAPNAQNLATAKASLDGLLKQHGPGPAVLALLGELALHGEWQWHKAESYLKKALEQAPHHPDSHRLLAWLYLNRGAPEKAWTHAHALLGQTPLAPHIRADAGWLLLRLQKPQLALSLCADTAVLQSRANTLSCRHTAQARLGDTVAARITALQLMQEMGAKADELAHVSSGDAITGYAAFLEWRITAFTGTSWFQRAQLLAEAGQMEAASAALWQSFRAREPHLVKLASTIEFRRLRGSASYSKILTAVLGSSV